MATISVDAVCAPDNLGMAYARFARVRGRWSDFVSMAAVRSNPVAPMLQLAEQLKSMTYSSGRTINVPIQKADGTSRLIRVFPVRDRVTQRALLQVVQPATEANFLPSSFGFRPGRGVAGAINACQRWVRLGYGFAVDADVKQCFQSISVDSALSSAAPFVDDGQVLRLIQRCVQPHPDDTDANHGLSQGSALSPWLCNVFLHEFDCAMHAAAIPLVRYADDFVLFARSYGEARKALFCAARWLAARGLELNSSKTRIHRPEEVIPFLGVELPRPLPRLEQSLDATRQQYATTV